MKKPKVVNLEYNVEEVPEKIYGVKKVKVFKREPVEIPEDVELIDWGSLANQMSFVEYQELRKKHGLE